MKAFYNIAYILYSTVNYYVSLLTFQFLIICLVMHTPAPIVLSCIHYSPSIEIIPILSLYYGTPQEGEAMAFQVVRVVIFFRVLLVTEYEMDATSYVFWIFGQVLVFLSFFFSSSVRLLCIMVVVTVILSISMVFIFHTILILFFPSLLVCALKFY